MKRDYTNLREEVVQLKAEVASVKKSLFERQAPHREGSPSCAGGRVTCGFPANGSAGATPCPSFPVLGDWTEDLITRIMRQVGGMMQGSRLSKLASRARNPSAAHPPHCLKKGGRRVDDGPPEQGGKQKLAQQTATKAGKKQDKPQPQPQLVRPAAPAPVWRGSGDAGEGFDDNLSFTEVEKRGMKRRGRPLSPRFPPPSGEVAVTNKKAAPAAVTKIASNNNKKALMAKMTFPSPKS